MMARNRMLAWMIGLAMYGVLTGVQVHLLAEAQSTAAAPTQEVNALLAIKAAFGNPRTLASWNDTGNGTCSHWVGVKCSTDGHVTLLALPGRGLSGPLVEDVGNLTYLRKISLHDNAITGPLPQSLGALPLLKGIALFVNQFSGTIPVNLGNSSNLQALDISFNRLSGELPAGLAQSSKLYLLDCSYNNLWGGFPWNWTTSQSLLQIVLARNFLSGTLADHWGSLNASAPVTASPPKQLQVLDLRDNQFSGPIPPTLGTLVNLTELLLSDNKFDGEVPSELTMLTNLENLDLSSNSLNGTIPSGFGSLLPSTAARNSTKLSSVVISSLALSSSSTTNLTSLSLANNRLTGGIPEDFGNLTQLSTLNISNNQLTGMLPTALGNLKKLQVLGLGHNDLTGDIPEDFGNLTALSALDLQYNNMSGNLPLSLIGLNNLTRLNVSYNNFSGPIPPFAYPFNNSAFAGNAGLCGRPPFLLCPGQSAPAPSPGSTQGGRRRHHRHLSTGTIISIALGSALGALAFVCLCLLLLWRRKGESKNKAVARGGVVSLRMEKNGDGAIDSEELGGKLVHFDGPLAFSADHLLCATAEVLGKSAYGTVYKATLEDSNVIAVKRLREGIVKGQKEFESEVGSLGKIRHPNLLALRAYYWGPKDEKLLVFDYMACGSLAAFLHARGPETPLNWETRMKVAMGAARGLGYLHENENIVHGNLTSSNILLDARMNSKISDYGLGKLMTPQALQSLMASAGTVGYRAPELGKTKKPTAKADVYSFGIVLLELLTGKAPVEQSASDTGMDLAEWVSSVVKEEWTSEVFDPEIIKDAPHHQEEEMYNTLQLAMVCVNTSPTSRPEMEDVVRQLEEIRPDLRSSPDSAVNSGPESKKESS